MTGTRGITMVALLAYALAFACGDDNSTNSDDGSDPTAATLTADGWAAYGSGDYETAKSRFREALALDADHAPALSGIGWALAAGDSLEAAIVQWDGALQRDADLADAHAGRALALFAGETPDAAAAITSANAALMIEPRFDFTEDDVDWKDLRLLLGNAYVQTEEYALAAAQIDSLGGTPPAPSSDTYVQEIIAGLEALAD